MRKILVLFAAVYCLCSSCRKDYTCECYDGWGGGAFDIQIKAINHSRAEKKCLSHNDPPQTDDGTSGCHLK